MLLDCKTDIAVSCVEGRISCVPRMQETRLLVVSNILSSGRQGSLPM